MRSRRPFGLSLIVGCVVIALLASPAMAGQGRHGLVPGSTIERGPSRVIETKGGAKIEVTVQRGVRVWRPVREPDVYAAPVPLACPQAAAPAVYPPRPVIYGAAVGRGFGVPQRRFGGLPPGKPAMSRVVGAPIGAPKFRVAPRAAFGAR